MNQRLALDSVTAGYGPVEVLHRVSLSVPAGSVVALVGHNGAGKTSTMRVAAGLLRPRHGRILLDGRDVSSWSAYRRARAGITLVPEGRGIFPGLTVADNLEVAVRAPRGTDGAYRSRARDRILAAFPALAGRLTQRAGTLSGGEQQMLAMGRALAGPSRVLLLDEISMGLAPVVVEALYAAVGALRFAGTTIVLVEQYRSYALALADVCYVLARGQVTFAGEPGELRRPTGNGEHR